MTRRDGDLVEIWVARGLEMNLECVKAEDSEAGPLKVEPQSRKYDMRLKSR
jgi:hypothetical protein